MIDNLELENPLGLFSILPDEIIEEIVSHMDKETLKKYSSTSKPIKRIVDLFRKSLLIQEIGQYVMDKNVIRVLKDFSFQELKKFYLYYLNAYFIYSDPIHQIKYIDYVKKYVEEYNFNNDTPHLLNDYIL